MASAAEPTVNLKHQQRRETDRGCGRGRGYVSAGDHLGLTRSPFYHSQGSKQEVIESFGIFFPCCHQGFKDLQSEAVVKHYTLKTCVMLLT